MIRKLRAPVLANTPLAAPGHHVLSFDAGQMAHDARPGQFVAIAADTGAQILRRPFSFFSANPATGEASILFSLYGPTTRALAACQPGDTIDVIGPLGGRVFAADARPGARHVLVGGGYGVPPLAFFARMILAADPAAHVTIINGARTKDFLIGTDGLPEIGVTLRVCTDDGTCGHHGLVTGVLEELLADQGHPTHVYTCGPTPMMRAVAEMASALNVPCQVSLEVFMPCGVGICMGCAVARTDGTYARGCTDGPVFGAEEIAWP